MAMKIVTWVTIVAFVLFDCSCVVHRVTMERSESLSGTRGRGLEVLSVLTTDGETLAFGTDRPGMIRGEVIEGYTLNRVTIPIAKSEIISTQQSRQGQLQSVWVESSTQGTAKYTVDHLVSETSDSLHLVVISRDFTTIPLSTVDTVLIRKVDAGGTFLATLGGLALVAGIGVAIIAATKESCPFVYSFDGEQYQFDAEPYGGATCEGLKRTEWCRLEHATEIDGTFRLRLTNEVDETQYTDELTLVVVDHPEGIQVVPDVEGSFVAFRQVIPPLSACEASGRDILRYVGVDDWIFWESKLAECDDDRPLRQELTFRFPKPADASTVNLLFNGCTTLWGSQMVKRLLKVRGNQLASWYEQLDRRGPFYAALEQWGLREECFRLHARVKTATGWESRALLLGGGPFISEDKAYSLDISDVPGDTLTVRLTPPTLFWMINFIGVDYAKNDVSLEVTELTAREAIDQSGHDVRELLATTDGRYHSMPTIGEYADLVFDAPQLDAGMTRSVFVKASGYYDIHMEAQGPPDLELLSRVATEPGFAARYAIDQYLEWRASMLAAH